MSADEQKLRLFIALPVSPEVMANLATLQQELRNELPVGSVNWSRLENAHLTLRFLGPVDARKLDRLQAILDQTVRGFGTLSLTASRLGCFPDLRRPRVIWAGIPDEAGGLNLLHRSVVTATDAFTSVAAEDNLVGHITLGRVKHVPRPIAERIAELVQQAASRELGKWTTDRLQLIRSDLSTSGHQHTVVGEFVLNAGAGESA